MKETRLLHPVDESGTFVTQEADGQKEIGKIFEKKTVVHIVTVIGKCSLPPAIVVPGR